MIGLPDSIKNNFSVLIQHKCVTNGQTDRIPLAYTTLAYTVCPCKPSEQKNSLLVSKLFIYKLLILSVTRPFGYNRFLFCFEKIFLIPIKLILRVKF